MKLSGWVFMLSSWVFLAGLMGYCYWKILSTRNSKKD